jgi:xanthine dehydrogenase accessory factor
MSQLAVSTLNDLAKRRQPYVQATVVRAQVPTSARPGDQAIVLSDGTIDGFVGGHCAAGSVRAAGLEALRTGRSVLLRVLPEGEQGFPESPGAQVVVNPCLSGGALEIFLNPVLPQPIVMVSGDSPVARSVSDLAGPLGFEVREATHDGSGTVAVVIALHGGDELHRLRHALDVGIPFIALVASQRRGAALLDERKGRDEERARVQTPAGIDIGAQTPAEVALSILAGIVKAIRIDGVVALPEQAGPEQAAIAQPEDSKEPSRQTVLDPICGMTVVVGPETPRVVLAGVDYFFCCPGCRDRFVAENAS